MTIWQRCVYCSRCDKRRKRRRRSFFGRQKKFEFFFLFWNFFKKKNRKNKSCAYRSICRRFLLRRGDKFIHVERGPLKWFGRQKRENVEKNGLKVCRFASQSAGKKKQKQNKNKNKRIWMNGSRWKVIDGSMKRDDLMNEWLAGRISSSFDVRRKVGAACREKNGRCGSRRESSGVDRPPLSMIWFIFVLMRWNLIELMWPSGNAVY